LQRASSDNIDQLSSEKDYINAQKRHRHTSAIEEDNEDHSENNLSSDDKQPKYQKRCRHTILCIEDNDETSSLPQSIGYNRQEQLKPQRSRRPAMLCIDEEDDDDDTLDLSQSIGHNRQKNHVRILVSCSSC
jgi:hypothetical protein